MSTHEKSGSPSARSSGSPMNGQQASTHAISRRRLAGSAPLQLLLLELGRRHLDVVGGWHDAGDVRTYYYYTFQVPYQALRARKCGWSRDRDGDGRDDLLDSALWAARHLPKIRRPGTGALFPKVEDWPDYRRGNYWTDCVPGTPDDRHIMVREEAVDSVGQAVASAALFAREAADAYPEVADAALAVAKDRWAAWFDPESGQKRWRDLCSPG